MSKASDTALASNGSQSNALQQTQFVLKLCVLRELQQQVSDWQLTVQRKHQQLAEKFKYTVKNITGLTVFYHSNWTPL